LQVSPSVFYRALVPDIFGNRNMTTAHKLSLRRFANDQRQALTRDVRWVGKFFRRADSTQQRRGSNDRSIRHGTIMVRHHTQGQFYKSYAHRWVTKDVLNDVAYTMCTIHPKRAIKRQAQHFLHNGVSHRKARRVGSR
jgi:hypothetical protein